ncbi:hypothetical protein [Megasphaera vaginalis (ex Bordigoni et al. 2020)]|uniref:hypothetical protein n=1 Tax=Megasphaera vaginalis (ex Bordigoni et al. 2020) TaxID=2045301 RepID=UPI000C7C3AEF|nr:hypothetical protein [Megasphaera vaginalis (ex Bordigoni et al. 2020)]
MKSRIIKFGKWAERNWLPLIIIIACVMMIFLCLVLISWLYGYWSNALLGTRFEITSCWQGVTAVITGLAGIVGLAKAAWTKYGYDSRFNSAKCTMPIPAMAKEKTKEE